MILFSTFLFLFIGLSTINGLPRFHESPNDHSPVQRIQKYLGIYFFLSNYFLRKISTEEKSLPGEK